MRSFILLAATCTATLALADDPGPSMQPAAEAVDTTSTSTRAEARLAKRAAREVAKAERRARRALGPDTDGDGIGNATDACPTEPETVNGWADEDGCADRLATLLLVARVDRAPVRGATARITGAHDDVLVLDGATALSVPPEGTVDVALDYEGCWTGTARITLHEGPIIADVSLEQMPACGQEVVSASLDAAQVR